MIPDLKILNQTIDSLYLRLFSCSEPSAFLDNLAAEMRLYKQDFSYSEPSVYFVDLPNLGRFEVISHGHAPYEFILTNPEICDIRIWNTDRFISPAAIDTGHIYLDFHSKYLQCQSDDYGLVDDFIKNIFELFYINIIGDWAKVSRADLAVDIQGFDFLWEDLQKFAKRSRKIDALSTEDYYLSQLGEIQEKILKPQMCDKGGSNFTSLKIQHETDTGNTLLELNPEQLAALKELLNLELNSPSLTRLIFAKKLQTCYFGRFGSKLYARTYIKDREIKISGKEFLKDFWLANGWDNESQVVRHEFSMSGDFLREFHCDPVISRDGCLHWKDFKRAIPQIWIYLTSDWLRHTTAENSLNSRSPNSEFWDCVSSAFSPATPIYQRESIPPLASEKLAGQIISQAIGCIRTASALIIGGWAKAYHWLSGEQEDYLPELLHALSDEILDSIQFTDIKAKRDHYGIDEFTDTQFSAALRRDKLKLGRGS